MLSLVLSAAILAFGRMVDAQPTSVQPAAAQPTGKLAPLIWIGNKPVIKGQSGSPCGEDDDLLECATKIWTNYTVSPEAELGKRSMAVPVKVKSGNWVEPPQYEDGS